MMTVLYGPQVWKIIRVKLQHCYSFAQMKSLDFIIPSALACGCFDDVKKVKLQYPHTVGLQASGLPLTTEGAVGLQMIGAAMAVAIGDACF